MTWFLPNRSHPGALGGFVAMNGKLDLEVEACGQECGCAASSGGRLLALRDRHPLGNGLNTKVNNSCTTAADSPDYRRRFTFSTHLPDPAGLTLDLRQLF